MSARTLVISDLHLGARLGRDVLRRPDALEALLEAVDGVDRLVLLGDVVELAQGRPRLAMAVSAPVVRALGRRLGPDRDVVLVPGNHDAALVRPWVRAHRASLRPDTVIPLDATPGLAQLTEWMAPARVRVHYPGVWLSARVWATHGHYLDRHLLPVSAYGVARGLLRRPPSDGATPLDYERTGPSLSRIEGALTERLPRPLAAAVENAAELLRAVSMPANPTRLLTPGMAPVTSHLLGLQMRRASLPALARVVHRLDVDPDWVVFGHVHRKGPLDDDDPAGWEGPGGRPRVANTGAWVYEPLLVHRAAPPHPYWPGGAVRIEGEGDPRALGLLDHLEF